MNDETAMSMTAHGSTDITDVIPIAIGINEKIESTEVAGRTDRDIAIIAIIAISNVYLNVRPAPPVGTESLTLTAASVEPAKADLHLFHKPPTDTDANDLEYRASSCGKFLKTARVARTVYIFRTKRFQANLRVRVSIVMDSLMGLVIGKRMRAQAMSTKKGGMMTVIEETPIRPPKAAKGELRRKLIASAATTREEFRHLDHHRARLRLLLVIWLMWLNGAVDMLRKETMKVEGILKLIRRAK